MEDRLVDVAEVPGRPGLIMDYSGKGRRVNAEVQYKVTLSDHVRAVIGQGHKQEQARSYPLYSTDDWQSFRESRVFGTVEWRVTPQWLLNTGWFVGQHSRVG